MPDSDMAPASPRPDQGKAASWLSKGAALALSIILVGFILLESRAIWAEWQALRHDWVREKHSAVIGYEGINLNPSYAARPNDWFREEGQYTLLWSGWQPGVGHRWFRVGRGDVDRSRISRPIGRDVVQAIDRPVVEVGGGRRWGRIPGDAPVAGLMAEGIPCVYPLLLMRKVVVVNDEVGARPLLVTFSPAAPDHLSINAYDPVHEGRRVTLGLSGYAHDQAPMLYDRGTESLWVERDGAIEAIAGDLKGARLRRIGRVPPVSWASWSARHPKSRLVVGADRTEGAPAR